MIRYSILIVLIVTLKLVIRMYDLLHVIKA